MDCTARPLRRNAAARDALGSLLKHDEDRGGVQQQRKHPLSTVPVLFKLEASDRLDKAVASPCGGSSPAALPDGVPHTIRLDIGTFETVYSVKKRLRRAANLAAAASAEWGEGGGTAGAAGGSMSTVSRESTESTAGKRAEMLKSVHEAKKKKNHHHHKMSQMQKLLTGELMVSVTIIAIALVYHTQRMGWSWQFSIYWSMITALTVG